MAVPSIAAANRPIAFIPQPGPQSYLLSCPIHDVLFGGSRGGGKTAGLLGDAAAHCGVYGKHAKAILFRRTYDELDEVKAQADEIYPKLGAYYKSGKNTWYFPNGATVKLRYLKRDEDASHYQGHSYTWLGVDEAGNFPDPIPINKLRATLRSPHGVPTFVRLSANPGGPGHQWIKERYIDPAPQGLVPMRDEASGELRVFIPSKLEDNRILSERDPQYRLRIMQSGPPWLVQAWLYGDWNATPEGGLIKAAWFQRYSEPPAEFIRLVQSWDTAYKPDEHNDPSVCTTWGQTRTGFYLLDVYRAKPDFPALQRAAISLAQRWKPHAVLIEEKGSGISLVQQLRATTSLPIIPVDPGSQKKIDRLVAVSSLFESGRVYLPSASAWSLDYEVELTIFPLAPHDDQVDSTSQALSWMAQWGAQMNFASTGSTRAALEEADYALPERDDRGIPSLNDLRGF